MTARIFSFSFCSVKTSSHFLWLQPTRSSPLNQKCLSTLFDEFYAEAAWTYVEAQDEMVALELQFNLAEQRSEKLEMENKELVERWMKRMGEEAEKVNRDSRWE